MSVKKAIKNGGCHQKNFGGTLKLFLRMYIYKALIYLAQGVFGEFIEKSELSLTLLDY
ncbi:hypothetical protein QCI42_21740 [Bacillus fungorum]|uniref:hypothetical protein n=1 Tax=Bacillus fungorum TaxID=2039284 RepID=UPI0033999164